MARTLRWVSVPRETRGGASSHSRPHLGALLWDDGEAYLLLAELHPGKRAKRVEGCGKLWEGGSGQSAPAATKAPCGSLVKVVTFWIEALKRIVSCHPTREKSRDHVEAKGEGPCELTSSGLVLVLVLLLRQLVTSTTHMTPMYPVCRYPGPTFTRPTRLFIAHTAKASASPKATLFCVGSWLRGRYSSFIDVFLATLVSRRESGSREASRWLLSLG